MYEYKGEAPDGTDLVIKDGTKGIACEAIFGQNGISSITMPDTLMFIANRGISGVKNLQSITVSKNLLELNNHSLNINSDSLTDIYIPKTLISVNRGGSFNEKQIIHYAGTEEEFKKIDMSDKIKNQVVFEGK